MEWQGEEAYAHIILEVTQDKLEQDKLEQEAYSDTLTQIGNRYYFQKKLDELLKMNEDLIFCYCDLDHLKTVNDTYGHMEGDWYVARKKIRQIQIDFRAESTRPYDKNFSFGIVKLSGTEKNVDIDDILKQADAAMYQQKKEHKNTQKNSN